MNTLKNYVKVQYLYNTIMFEDRVDQNTDRTCKVVDASYGHQYLRDGSVITVGVQHRKKAIII